MRSAPNKSKHRMSGDNINLKFGHQSTPLIGAPTGGPNNAMHTDSVMTFEISYRSLPRNR